MGFARGISARTRVCVALLVVVMTCVPISARVRGADVSASAARDRIAVGNAHSCAIASNDVVWCWGDNTYGQLGSSAHAAIANGQTATPVQAAALPGGRVARRISSGDSHVCVLANDGSVWCWGYNGYGEVGVSGGNQANPVQVALPATASTVAAGGNFTCAVLTTNDVMCWGRNNRGQLGNGTQDAIAHATPSAVTSIPSSFVVASLDLGALHACATSTSGDTWCWGAYNNGRLGTSSTSDSLTPGRITAFGGGSSISAAAGTTHSCVVVGTRAWCFGSNTSGQLGSDPAVHSESSTPLSVTFTSSADMVAAGKDFTCALLSSATLECFGLNDNGQLGESLATASRHTPQQVSGIGTGVVDVALGATHACAAFTSGAVKCWGAGAQGQLGNGGTNRQISAVSVGTLNVAPTTTTTTTTTSTSTSSTTSSTTTSTTTSTTSTIPSGSQSSEFNRSTSEPRYLTVKRGRYLTARAMAEHVALAIPKTSQGSMRFTIVRGVRYCTFVGTKVKGLRKGTCSVLVTLIPKRGSRILRTAKVVVS